MTDAKATFNYIIDVSGASPLGPLWKIFVVHNNKYVSFTRPTRQRQDKSMPLTGTIASGVMLASSREGDKVKIKAKLSIIYTICSRLNVYMPGAAGGPKNRVMKFVRKYLST